MKEYILNKSNLHFLIIILVLPLLFSSCDSPGIILLHNPSSKEVVFQYAFKGEKIDMSIPLRKNKKEYILLGFGHVWTEEKIKNFAGNLKYIQILTSDDTLTFRNESILILLTSSKKSLNGKKLTINLEDVLLKN